MQEQQPAAASSKMNITDPIQDSAQKMNDLINQEETSEGGGKQKLEQMKEQADVIKKLLPQGDNSTNEYSGLHDRLENILKSDNIIEAKNAWS